MKNLQFAIILFLGCFLFTSQVKAQQLIPSSVIQFLSGENDEIQKAIVDKKGNIYIAGVFQSESLNFGEHSVTKKGAKDIFLLKLNSEGIVQFVKSFPATQKVGVTAIGVDSELKVSLTGYFTGSIQFDSITKNEEIRPEDQSFNFVNSFLTQINQDGSVAWVNAYGGNAQTNSITVDSEKNIYLNVSLSGKIVVESLGTSIYPNYRSHYITLKLDESGKEIWYKNFGGKLLCDNQSSLYVVGDYSDSIQCDDIILKSIIDKENHNLFIAKMNLLGEVQWAKDYCNKEHALLGDAVLDTLTNSILLTGTFKTDSLTFNEIVLQNNGAADIYFAKVDTSGNALSAKNFGGTRADYAFDLTRISADYYAMVGNFSSDSILFGNHTIYKSDRIGRGDIYLAILDNDGNAVWAKSFLISEAQNIRNLLSNGNDITYLLGDFSNGLNGNKSQTINDDPTVIDNSSFYLIKLVQTATAIKAIENTPEAIELFPNPVVNTFSFQLPERSNKVVSVKIYDANGRIEASYMLSGNQFSMNVENLSKGLHIVAIQTEHAQYRQRFIKK